MGAFDRFLRFVAAISVTLLVAGAGYLTAVVLVDLFV